MPRSVPAVHIRSGPMDVLASGSVIAFEGQPIEITFSAANETLKLIFEFSSDVTAKEPHYQGRLSEPDTLTLTLFNFDSPLGTGTTKPQPLGNLGSRPVHLHYRVYAMDSSDKLLHYTLYLGQIEGAL
jgi:hypothetical protein